MSAKGSESTEMSTEDPKISDAGEIIPGFKTFDDYVTADFGVVKMGVKSANALPAGENFNYYNCFATFRNVQFEQKKKIVEIMQRIVQCTGAAGSMRGTDLEEKFELLIESNDRLQDRATILMDEASGVARQPTSQPQSAAKKTNFGSWNTSGAATTPEALKSTNAARLLAAPKHIQRPQLTFKDKVDNSLSPWVPRIKDKPNSLKPLGIYLIPGENGEVFCHPYEFELDRFVPSDSQLQKTVPKHFKPLNETPLIVIEKPGDLKILLEDLKNYSEISVDLEHHSYRTFQGITCLMQISTRDTDYLIDTLALRSDVHILNEIFTKPSVLKVLHGAEQDIQWLQRDLSLYIVNMFDTHQAAKQLKLPFLSLAYLMKTHCNIDPNKHFQLADWRVRPLPEELMKYAREDTHYLLYIKDILQNALIDVANGKTNILKAVYDRSTEICKQIYEKPICDESSYMNMYRKSQKMFNNRQICALKELYLWRDAIARQEDDSIGYVLPNHMLLNIAETLPREMQGILACCNPIPPLVRQNLLKLHKLILKAREQPLIKPVLEQDIRQRLTQRNQAASAETWMWSPHDIPSGTEVQANLPCLLDEDKSQMSQISIEKVAPIVTVFNSPENSDDEEAQEKLRKIRKLFVSPFERYKRVMPMVAAQEEEERVRKEKEAKEKLENKEKEGDKDKADIAERVDRIHEHFLKICREKLGQEKPEKIQSQPVVLGDLSGGKKRRREANMEGDKCKIEKLIDISALAPPIISSNRNYQDDDAQMPKSKRLKESDDVKPSGMFNARIKNQKKANRRHLEQQGMLPKSNFDYREVDFSSFQGGSKGPEAKLAVFQQKQHKDKPKKGKRKGKKQKLGI